MALQIDGVDWTRWRTTVATGGGAGTSRTNRLLGAMGAATRSTNKEVEMAHPDLHGAAN